MSDLLQVRNAEERSPAWFTVAALLLWLSAGAVAFLPFALDTSPWDALMLRVPGHQGNWWHVLVGLPFFLAFPMIWLRLRSLFSLQLSTTLGRRVIWVAVAISTMGTILVEAPFLLHLAGTRGWPRLSMLGLGLGILIGSAVLLFLRRRRISPTRACLVGIDAAYLANLSLCLVVYSGAAGTPWSKLGWIISMVVVWLVAVDLVWLFLQTFRTQSVFVDAPAV